MTQNKLLLADLSPEVIAAIGDSTDAESIWNKAIDELFDGNTDLALVADTEANLLSRSEELGTSPWAQTRMTVNTSTGVASPIPGVDFQGFVGTLEGGASTSHFNLQSVTMASAGRITVTGFAKNAALDWWRVDNNTTGQFVFFDLANLAVGDMSVGTKWNLVQHANGVEYFAEFDGVLGTNLLLTLPSETDTDAAYVGDGVTIDTYAIGTRAYAGTIADNVKYPGSNASPVAPVTTVTATTYKQNKWDAGLVQKADGTWKPASSVDGDLMDESVGNVAVLREAEKYKLHSDGTWGDLVSDAVHYSNTTAGDFLYYNSQITISSSTIGTMKILQGVDGANVDLTFKGNRSCNVRLYSTTSFNSAGSISGGKSFDFYVDNTSVDSASIKWEMTGTIVSSLVYNVRVEFGANNPFTEAP